MLHVEIHFVKTQNTLYNLKYNKKETESVIELRI